MNDVTLKLGKDEAQSLSDSISDFLCWVSGYNAGCERGGETGYVFSTSELRNLNIKIKDASRKASENE